MLTPRAITAEKAPDPPSVPLEEGGGRDEVPLFHSNVRSSTNTRKEWEKAQRRAYSNMLSWFRECSSRQLQFFNVMLSSSAKSPSGSLTDHFEELRRRILKKYGYEVEYFKVHTREGRGVLHLILGVKCDKPVWIGQIWLSKTWESIHGAFAVWIARVRHGVGNHRGLSKYFVTQYFAGQSAYVRHSYSWWKCKFALRKNFRVLISAINCGHNSMLSWEPLDQSARITYADALFTWGLFLDGAESAMLGDRLYAVRDRVIEYLF